MNGEIFDLSHPVVTGMQVYPGDPEVRIARDLELATDGVEVSRLDMGSHTGTHLDAPSHSVAGGANLDGIELSLLWGAAAVLRPREVAANREVSLSVVDIPEQLPAIVCIASGWDCHFGTAAALTHPYLSVELARALWERGARVLGVDMLSPDATGACASEFPVHEFWLGGGGLILENLTGLVGLPATVELSALPLRLAGVDGSPVRAVARPLAM